MRQSFYCTVNSLNCCDFYNRQQWILNSKYKTIIYHKEAKTLVPCSSYNDDNFGRLETREKGQKTGHSMKWNSDARFTTRKKGTTRKRNLNQTLMMFVPIRHRISVQCWINFNSYCSTTMMKYFWIGKSLLSYGPRGGHLGSIFFFAFSVRLLIPFKLFCPTISY